MKPDPSTKAAEAALAGRRTETGIKEKEKEDQQTEQKQAISECV